MQSGLKNKILLIVTSTILGAFIFGWYASTLPVFYQSTTVLAIVPPTISVEVRKSLTEEELLQKLQSVNQQVVSRAYLEPMVVKYNLFETERAKGMPMELVIEKMKKNISIEPENTDGKFSGVFKISYKDKTPMKARNVVTNIANNYVNQFRRTTCISEKTVAFVETQIAKLKKELDELKSAKSKREIKNDEYLLTYNVIQANYKELQKELEIIKTQSRIDSSSESDFDQEHIKVVDFANLPQTSVSPYRPYLLTAMGIGFGFMTGLMLVVFAGLINSTKMRFGKLDLR